MGEGLPAQRVGPHLRRVRAATDEREAHRVGRLEVGQALQHERAPPAPPTASRTRSAAASPPGQPPSGDDGRRLAGQVERGERDDDRDGRDRADPAAALVAPAPAPRPTTRPRRPEPDGNEHDRVHERVIVVVREARHNRRQAARGDRKSESRPDERQAEPATGEPLIGRPGDGPPDNRPDDTRCGEIAATGASVSRPVSGQAQHPQADHDDPDREARRRRLAAARHERRSRSGPPKSVETSWIASGT